MVEERRLHTNADRDINVKYYGETRFQTTKEGGKSLTITADDYGFNSINWIIDEIKKARNNGEDRVILLAGEVRSGKSDLAAHIATRLGLTDTEQIRYEPDKYLKTLHELEEGGVAWLDEGGRGMYYKNAMTKENKLINQTFQQIGAKNLVSIICLPHREILDKELRKLRIHYWGQVKFSGYNRGFVKWRIAGKKHRKIKERKIPRHENEWRLSVYWEPLFRMRYPKFREHNGLSRAAYKKQKMKKLNEFTEDALRDIEEKKDGKSRIYSAVKNLKEKGMDVKEIAKITDYSRDHIYKILKK